MLPIAGQMAGLNGLKFYRPKKSKFFSEHLKKYFPWETPGP